MSSFGPKYQRKVWQISALEFEIFKHIISINFWFLTNITLTPDILKVCIWGWHIGGKIQNETNKSATHLSDFGLNVDLFCTISLIVNPSACSNQKLVMWPNQGKRLQNGSLRPGLLRTVVQQSLIDQHVNKSNSTNF